MKPNELPERLEVSHGGASHWIGDSTTHERVRCYDSSGAADNILAHELARRWNAHKELVDVLKEASDLYIDPKAAPPEFMRALRDALKHQEILTP